MNTTDIKEKIKLLKDYFVKRSDVSMVFVFGSYAREQEISESDFDVAVYFNPKGKVLEWEETTSFKDEGKIWSDIEKIVCLNTDLVVLNRTPSTVAFSILQDGIPVIIKNNSLYLNFFLTISSVAEDFREFSRDFWAIKQRSLSLKPADKERLLKIVDFLEAEIADYPDFADLDQTAYGNDNSLRRNVERWAENIVNSSIDIAKILLASEKKKMPQTYREILHELSLLENFEKKTAEKLARFSKLRNILAHEYIDIRFNQIKKFVKESKPAYKKLVDFVKNKLSGANNH